MSTQDLKALFRKIALNPDAEVDWSEVSYYCIGTDHGAIFSLISYIASQTHNTLDYNLAIDLHVIVIFQGDLFRRR